MPKTKFQQVIFTVMMVFVMVYAMVCYNITLNVGTMSNKVFLMAFHEMLVMGPIAFILEMFVVDKAAKALAFRVVKPTDRPILIILAISTFIVCLMCPMMSFAATILYKHAGKQFVAVWFQTTAMNFPMALFFQLFIAGPCVRFLFTKMFSSNKAQ